MDRLGLYAKNLTSPVPKQPRIHTMAEFQINNEDLTSLKGKVVIITGKTARPVTLAETL